MKAYLVCLLLLFLGACEWPEPMAPGTELQQPVPLNSGPAVIMGRVVASGSVPLQAAQVRVVEASATVSTDEDGDYRIVLPTRFLRQSIPLQVRAIGFKPQTVRLVVMPGTQSVDFVLAVDVNLLSCEMVTR